MILYSNSDSYGVFSTPGIDNIKDVYGEYIANSLNAEYINRGRSGSSNNRILRTSMRDLIKLRKEKPQEKIQALISLATTYRSETWTDNNIQPQDQDGHFCSFQVGNVRHNEQIEYARIWTAYYDNEAEQTNLLWQILMFTKALKSYNIDYLVWWGPTTDTIKTIDYLSPFIKDFYQEFKKDKNILSFEDFGFCSWCLDQGFVPFDEKQFGKYGHHSPDAHQTFANYLLENYL
jgi:hypothetical protein